jgi:hypothetical protein
MFLLLERLTLKFYYKRYKRYKDRRKEILIKLDKSENQKKEYI